MTSESDKKHALSEADNRSTFIELFSSFICLFIGPGPECRLPDRFSVSLLSQNNVQETDSLFPQVMNPVPMELIPVHMLDHLNVLSATVFTTTLLKNWQLRQSDTQ